MGNAFYYLLRQIEKNASHSGKIKFKALCFTIFTVLMKGRQRPEPISSQRNSGTSFSALLWGGQSWSHLALEVWILSYSAVEILLQEKTWWFRSQPHRLQLMIAWRLTVPRLVILASFPWVSDFFLLYFFDRLLVLFCLIYSLGWYWLVKSYRFQVYISIIHLLYISLCVHPPPSVLLASPYIWPPFPSSTSLSFPSPTKCCLCLWVVVSFFLCLWWNFELFHWLTYTR